MKIEMKDITKELKDFAEKHDIELIEKGEVGFGRDCVGFLKGKKYIEHNPYDMIEFEPISQLEDDRLYPPDDVHDAYHKTNCLAVLVHEENYDEALRQLHTWMTYLESLGEVEIVKFNTGATGVQAMFSGTHSYAITIKK